MAERKSISRFLGVAIAVSLLACNASEPAGPQTDNETAAEFANARVTIGVTQEFESMNPLIMQMMASHYVYYFTGRPLVSINADWEWECWLCVEIPTLENGLAEIVTDEGAKKLTSQWEIRDGATTRSWIKSPETMSKISKWPGFTTRGKFENLGEIAPGLAVPPCTQVRSLSMACCTACHPNWWHSR